MACKSPGRLVVLLAALSAAAFALPPALDFEIAPAVTVPIGASSDYFGVGGGGLLAAGYRLDVGLPLWVRAELGFSAQPLADPIDRALSVFSLGGGVGTELELMRRLPLGLHAGGGYYYGSTEGEDSTVVGGGNP